MTSLTPTSATYQNSSTFISIIVPAYNVSKNHLQRLYHSLLNQTHQNFEVLLVDDFSATNYYDLLFDKRFQVLYKKENSGPALSRNIGVQHALHNYLFFTDSDCSLHSNTLQEIVNNLSVNELQVGNTITETKTWFGKAVAFLGFPGGGNIGFHNVWQVDSGGYTNSLSSCNVAISKELFLKLGMFDITYPVPGGEDTAFAIKALNMGYRIKYNSQQIIYHVEQQSLSTFIKWTNTRGRGIYHFKNRAGKGKSYLSLRLWSLKNSLLAAGIYSPIVITLFIIMLISIRNGFTTEKKRLN